MLPGPASRNALEHRSAKAVQRYTFLCDLDLPGSPSVFAFRLLTQLVLLSAAAQREDGTIELAPNREGGAAHKVADKLLRDGLIKEIPNDMLGKL